MKKQRSRKKERGTEGALHKVIVGSGRQKG